MVHHRWARIRASGHLGIWASGHLGTREADRIFFFQIWRGIWAHPARQTSGRGPCIRGGRTQSRTDKARRSTSGHPACLGVAWMASGIWAHPASRISSYIRARALHPGRPDTKPDRLHLGCLDIGASGLLPLLHPGIRRLASSTFIRVRPDIWFIRARLDTSPDAGPSGRTQTRPE